MLPDFELETLAGERVKLSAFPAKAYLVVNTASHCAFTHQYAELESLYQDYKEQGLVVLGFPCDQFGHQEPGDHQEISNFCQKNYGVTFPMFAKIDVNGKHAHPLFRFLKTQARGFLGTTSIKWNFTKFLITPTLGHATRFAPNLSPEKLRTLVLSKIFNEI